MSASAMGGDWVAAYLDWAQWGAAIAPTLFASDGISEAVTCSSEETATAYLEWIVAAPTAAAEALVRTRDSAGRTLPRDDAATLDAFRESMLLTALRTEADYLHILRRVMDAGDAAFPARKLVVDALIQAEKLLEDEQRAWCALMGLRNGELLEPRAQGERDFLAGWPLALEGVAADVHALAGKLLELQVH
jgi:hypothetical protein